MHVCRGAFETGGKEAYFFKLQKYILIIHSLGHRYGQLVSMRRSDANEPLMNADTDFRCTGTLTYLNKPANSASPCPRFSFMG